MAKDQYTLGHHAQWRDQETDIQTHTLQVRGTIRMEELLGELVRYNAPEELYITGAQIKWEAIGSYDAIEERERNREESRRRTEMWERQQLNALLLKYENRQLES